MDIFKEYEKVEMEMALLETKKSDLRTKILDQMNVLGETKHDGSFGTFKVNKRKSYTYTEKVDSLMEKVKTQKYKEEINGLAIPKETIFISYVVAKI